FFSSRRRHTRSKRDWSSDVCSSDLTRLSHQKMDGKAENENGMFKVGLSTGPSPGNLVGVDSAAQNINCRCKKLYSVNGQMPEVRRARNEDGSTSLIPWQSYEDWERDKRANNS